MARLTVCLLLLAMSSAASMGAFGAFENFETYLVKSKEVDKLPEGLVILRRFMPSTLSAAERCQRYGLVLYKYRKEPLDQFRLANAGLTTSELVWKNFKAITMDDLRDLYMDAIKQVQTESDLDPSFVELVDCLKAKFNNYDAKARSFLNNKQLQRTVEQYKSITSQKMDFLLDDSFRHPTITLGELEEPVRRTVVNWFGGDEKRAYSRFQNSLAPPPSTTTTTTTTTTQAPIPAPSYGPPMPDPMHLEPKVLSPHPFMPPPPAPAPIMNPYSGEPQGSQPQPPRPQMTLEPQLGAESLAHQLPEQQIQLLLKVIGLLHDLYNTLPLDSKLNDRCPAYSQLLTAAPEILDSQLVSDISHQVGARIAQNGPSEQKFVPDSNIRENFLFTVSAFPKNDMGDETWMDLVDCISQWELVDNNIRNFMSNPQHYYEVMSLPPSQ